MKEAFFILAVMIVLLALTAFRYRRQINTVLGVWRMLSSARKMRSPEQVKDGGEVAAGQLVNCAKCGTWVPATGAIRIPPKVYYCSRMCLEKVVETN